MADARLLDEALLLHKLGRIAEAKERYEEILRGDPEDASSLHLLGVIAFQEARPQDAERLIRRAIAARPDRAAYHNNLGNALRAQSRTGEAIESYRSAISCDPDFADALGNLGAILRDRGELGEARTHLERAVALAPSNPFMLNNLANVLDAQGESERAIAAYRQALALDPRYAEACRNLGRALVTRERFGEALEWLRKSVEFDPAQAGAHAQLGIALRETRAFDEARACLQRAVELDPANAEYANNLGIVLFETGHFAEAEEHYRRAAALDPSSGSALCNLGILRLKAGLYEEAIGFFDSATRAYPATDGAHNGHGVALVSQGLYHEAMPYIERELQYHPESPDARMNLGMCLLASGRFEEGWPHFAYRLKRKGYAVASGPEWQGDDIGEHTLLVFPEQGAGDNIQFARYFPLLRERCPRARIVYPCPESLVGLFTRSFAHLRIEMPVREDTLHIHGVQIGLLSVPGVLGTTLSSMPAAVPYVVTDPARGASWRERLGSIAGPKVGLAWAGNPEYATDRDRSIPFDTFRRLLGIPGVAYVSLQKRPAGVAPPADAAMVDWMDEARDFADTAALVDQLDLVVSVDTSIAHLAGALGKPVWLLNRINTDWRWMLEREDSPWYPTMRIFRQPARGDWGSVLDGARRALLEWSSTRNP